MIIIYYGSESGKTKYEAEIVYNCLLKFNLKVKIKSAIKFNINKFNKYRFILFIISTAN